MIIFKIGEKNVQLKEQEKFLEIKKEVINIIRNKEEKLEVNNIN